MSECKIVAVLNRKGGVCKTTTTHNLGVALVQRGYRVLLVDCDTQRNLSISLGLNRPDEECYTLCELLQPLIDVEVDEVDIQNCIHHLENGVDFIAKDRGKTREGAWPRAPRALRSAAIPPIYYFWGEPRYARAHPRPDGLFLLPHTPSTCDSAPVGRHVRNRGESACSSASRSATGGHGKPRRTRPVPDHPVRGFSTAA